MIQGIDEHPEEEIHIARSGRILSSEASVPVKVGHVTLPVWMCSPTWKLSEPCTFSILRRLYQEGMIDH